MSLRSQASKLLGQSAKMRQQIFGADNTGADQLGRMSDATDRSATFTCYVTFKPSQEQLTESIFKDVHDGIMRVAKTEENFVAGKGKSIVLIGADTDGSDLVLEIKEIPPSPMNPEWVVGLANTV